MAKAKKQADVQSEGALAVAEAPHSHYRVGLDCPTPVGRNPLEVEAAGPEEAKQAFLRENNLSDSEWPFTVERI